MPEKWQWIEPASNILIPLWKINFFTRFIHSTSDSVQESQNEVDFLFHPTAHCAFRSHNQISNFVCNRNTVARCRWYEIFNSPHSQGLIKKANDAKWMDAGRKKFLMSELNNFSHHCMHARYCNGSDKKKFQNARQWEAIENFFCERRKKEMKFALLTIVDAFLWFYVATRCRKKCDLQFSECHSLWINCIIINTRGQVDVIAVVVWDFCDFYRLVGSKGKFFVGKWRKNV